MFSQVRTGMVGVIGLALGICVMVGFETANAQDADSIDKIAAAFEKSDAAGAKKMAGDVAKKIMLDDLMHCFKPRDKKGLGVGAKAGAVKPDGIEKKLLEMAKKTLKEDQLTTESEALVHMGYHTAALAEIMVAKTPDKDDGKKKKKDWVAWSDELRNASLQFAVAAKDKKGPALKTAAAKMDGACSKCHDVFRE